MQLFHVTFLLSLVFYVLFMVMYLHPGLITHTYISGVHLFVLSLIIMLVKSDIGPERRAARQNIFLTAKMGNFSCLCCSCCGNILKGDSFSHPYTGEKYKVRQRFRCSSSFVVYVITCPCGLYYVGEMTMEVKARISKPKSTIKKGQIELPVPAHFIEKGHMVSQLRYRVIVGVPQLRGGGDRQSLRKNKELYWIFMLDT